MTNSSIATGMKVIKFMAYRKLAAIASGLLFYRFTFNSGAQSGFGFFRWNTD